jgi:hypothetical protein
MEKLEKIFDDRSKKGKIPNNNNKLDLDMVVVVGAYI